MSNEVKESDNALQEVARKVVISPEDVNGAADFWNHFKVPMESELRAAFDAFCKDPSIENQDAIKLTITHAIGFTDHEAFNDEMFKEIVQECRNVNYDLQFDKELENTLGREGDEEKPVAAPVVAAASTETPDTK